MHHVDIRVNKCALIKVPDCNRTTRDPGGLVSEEPGKPLSETSMSIMAGKDTRRATIVDR